MAYGLRIINDNSELLIDSEFVNPTFIQKLEFNTTPTFVKTGVSTDQAYPDFIRRDYSTAIFTIATGATYIILWVLPDIETTGQPDKDVWYHFPSSTINISKIITCSVYANSTGSPITYALPTAYIFGINAAAVASMSSTGPALRMYNSLQVKTFDSNLIQLVPYSAPEDFGPPGSATADNVYLPVPDNPIYLLPKSGFMFAANNGFGYSNEKVFEATYKRKGDYVYTRTLPISYEDGKPELPTSFATFFTGNTGNLTVISADADLYQAPGSSTGGGTNPTYTLSSNFLTVNEGTTFIVTLTTTLISNGSSIPWTVTGIDANDLTTGGLTGNFVIQNNTATATFTLANDLTTEGTEVFTLSLTGLNRRLLVSILDTSKPASEFSFGAVTAVNEGSTTGYVNFEYNYAAGKVVTFAIVAPAAVVTAANSNDVTLNFLSAPGLVINQNNNGAGTFAVGYNVAADTTTEGTEYFRISATVDSTTYYSSDIAINDTSLSPVAVSYSLTASNSWTESSTDTATFTVTGKNGTVFYFTTNNTLVAPQTASVTADSDNYSIEISYTTGSVTSATSVTLQVRTGSASGTIVATKIISVSNTAASYSFGAVSPINEGSNGSVQFNYSNSPGVSFGFSLTSPSSGEQNDGTDDVTLNTTDFTVGNTDAGGTVTVSYSVGNDSTTEGPEYFRIQALVNGVYYTSDDISISDTSTAPVYPAAGTNSGIPYCGTGADQYTRYQDKHDGSGSTYPTVVAYNSAACEYTAPTYALSSTWTSLANGSTNTFYLDVTPPPAGDNISVSVSGTGATRVSVSPASIITVTSTASYAIEVTTTTPTSTVAAQSVTITVSYNNGASNKNFSFTVPAYTVTVTTAPTVVSVEAGAYLFSGQGLDATINFSGAITSDTYIQVKIGPAGAAFGQSYIYYPSSTGAATTGTVGAYTDYVTWYVETTSAYYAGPVNPGGFFPPINGVKISVKAVTASGASRQDYVDSGLITLDGGSGDGGGY